MKLSTLVLGVLMLPVLATAESGEVYKWRDSNGVVRYSDTPPPSNVKHEVYGKKGRNVTPAQAPLAPVEGNATVSINRQKASSEKEQAEKNKAQAPLTKEEEAGKRAKEAEDLKKKEAQKKLEDELKAENCKNAKASLATYVNGGRIVRTNEKGEREYLSDADIAKNKLEAQSQVDKYCN